MLKRQLKSVLFGVGIVSLILTLSLQASACTKRDDTDKPQTQLSQVSDESNDQSFDQNESTDSDAQQDQHSDQVIGGDDESHPDETTGDADSDDTTSDDTY